MTERSEQSAPAEVASDDLLDRLRKIQEAWLSYNVLEAEITYALEEGGDTDVTRSQVNEAWNVANDLIMSNNAMNDTTKKGGREETDAN